MSSMTVGDMINYLQTLVDEKGEAVKDYQIIMDITSGDTTSIAMINGIRVENKWKEIRLLN